MWPLLAIYKLLRFNKCILTHYNAVKREFYLFNNVHRLSLYLCFTMLLFIIRL